MTWRTGDGMQPSRDPAARERRRAGPTRFEALKPVRQGVRRCFWAFAKDATQIAGGFLKTAFF